MFILNGVKKQQDTIVFNDNVTASTYWEELLVTKHMYLGRGVETDNVYVCMYVCMCVYIYIYIHTHTHYLYE